MHLDQSQLERFEHDGFLVLPELFSDSEVALLRQETDALFAEHCPANFREQGSGVVRTAMAIHERSPVFSRLARHPRLVRPAMQILADDALYLQQVKVKAKVAFTGEVWQWHYDFATHHNQDGVPRPLALNLHVFLDDVTEFNGPLWFIPGSHRHGALPAALDEVTTSYPLWCVDRDVVSDLVGARRHRLGHRPGRNRVDLRRLPGPRFTIQHVALESAHLLGDPESDCERLYAGDTRRPSASPRPLGSGTTRRRLPGAGSGTSGVAWSRECTTVTRNSMPV